MPSRRPHAKSRLGCSQCKKRKIKCDERLPRCGGCSKHNIECTNIGSSVNRRLLARSIYGCNRQYLDVEGQSVSERTDCYVSPASLYEQSPRSTSDAESSVTSCLSMASMDGVNKLIDRSSLLTGDRYMRDLEWMHHYSTETYRTLSEIPELQEIWKTVVPKEALAHRFLMHGILALSALHLSQINSKKGSNRMVYIEMATEHQSSALSLFRSELNRITPLNCNALFAFSSILSILTFASSPCTGIDQRMASVEGILGAFGLLRGVYGILHTAWDYIEKGQLGPVVREARAISERTVADEAREALPAMEYLDEVNSNASLDTDAKEAYGVSIRKLRDCFQKLNARCQQVRTAMSWPITVPPAYISLLKSRQPMALVILAHYCVILSWVDWCWWLTGWGERVIREIYRCLDARWRLSIQWPIKMVGLAKK
ncbi:hypothetical protein V1525DRAFT_400653 [Lipomyces kononenkoae]|uniref:Uncharacterized protein n=1 Tax=Lipomyces kononenkoae TaxID=34357 RepID=A0ACC3T4I1_LIPKO